MVDRKRIGFSGFLNTQNRFLSKSKIFSLNLSAWSIGSDGKMKIVTMWAL